ncbi:hypothetical protein II9_05649 [Bacillus cereus MSX-D12]|nr:hypothetical protein II9_05649 [Bacillus cereus MSX-D12]
MKELFHVDIKKLKDYEIIGFEQEEVRGKVACSHCGTAIKNIFIVSNGENIVKLGSECVKKIAEQINVITLKGIEKVPKKYQKSARRKLTFEEMDDLLPF